MPFVCVPVKGVQQQHAIIFEHDGLWLLDRSWVPHNCRLPDPNITRIIDLGCMPHMGDLGFPLRLRGQETFKIGEVLLKVVFWASIYVSRDYNFIYIHRRHIRSYLHTSAH